jgi:hypothetical protein
MAGHQVMVQPLGNPMSTAAAKWKQDQRARHKQAGRVAVTHYIYPEDRERVASYIKRVTDRRAWRRQL